MRLCLGVARKFYFVSAQSDKSEATDKQFSLSLLCQQLHLRHAAFPDIRLNLADMGHKKFLLHPFHV
jgi:hypothetical protein